MITNYFTKLGLLSFCFVLGKSIYTVKEFSLNNSKFTVYKYLKDISGFSFVLAENNVDSNPLCGYFLSSAIELSIFQPR